MKSKNSGVWAIVVILSILIIDQVSKIWIKTNMTLYDSIEIANWFKIYFIENPGMAFGMTLGGEEETSKQFGKLFLSVFRIIAIGLIAYYLYKIIKEKYSRGFIICVALIWAGAFGNIIDSVFYGKFFTESTPYEVAKFVSDGTGYAGWLHGNVVDMLYFPLIRGVFPDWLPFWGGEMFIFFSPVFNVADSAITVGVFILLLFFRKEFAKSLDGKKEPNLAK